MMDGNLDREMNRSAGGNRGNNVDKNIDGNRKMEMEINGIADNTIGRSEVNQRELYKKSAAHIQPLRTLYPEDLCDLSEAKFARHAGHRRFVMKRLVAVIAVLVFILALGTVSYAADIGGFKGVVNAWLYGEPVEVDIVINEDGTYTATLPDGREQSGGGIAFDGDVERPLTEEEIIEDFINQAEVEQDESGVIWFYYRNHKIDITEQIENNNRIAHVKIKDGVLPRYFTIKWEWDIGGGVSISEGTFGYPEL